MNNVYFEYTENMSKFGKFLGASPKFETKGPVWTGPQANTDKNALFQTDVNNSLEYPRARVPAIFRLQLRIFILRKFKISP